MKEPFKFETEATQTKEVKLQIRTHNGSCSDNCPVSQYGYSNTAGVFSL